MEIDAGESRLPLRGKVVGESSDAIRFRLEERWDVDVSKELVLGVELPSRSRAPEDRSATDQSQAE